MNRNCIICDKAFSFVPARSGTAKTCSNACRYVLQKQTRKGEANGRWKGGARTKQCQHCKQEFAWTGEPFVSWVKRKFCSQACIVAGQQRFSGEAHPRYNPESTSRSRGLGSQRQAVWAGAVRKRDDFTCRHCGKHGGDLHAHHVQTWKDAPDLRFDVDNGLTLCIPCHYKVHSAKGKLGEFGESPERTTPSQATHVAQRARGVEGVTTRW